MYNFGARSTLYLTFFSFCEMTITQRKPNETFRHFPWKSACMNFVPSRHSQILESIMPFNSQLPRLLVNCSNPRENYYRSIQEKYGRQKVPKYVFYWFSAWHWMKNGDLTVMPEPWGHWPPNIWHNLIRTWGGQIIPTYILLLAPPTFFINQCQVENQ